MKPKLGDIVTMNYDTPSTYYGVLVAYDSNDFPISVHYVAYSAEGADDKHGHDGGLRDRPTRGHWYTSYNKDTNEMNAGVRLLPAPKQKIIPLNTIAPERRQGQRVMLNAAGRLLFNVVPQHGGPYGEGVIVHADDTRIAGDYLVHWDNGRAFRYICDMLDAIASSAVQKTLWEET